MDLRIEFDGTRRLSTLFRSFPIAVTNKSQRISRKWARDLRDRVARDAPRDTGHYADDTIRVVGAAVVTDHPAARRLELGFVGMDSMGRHYTDMPRPHWLPNIEAVRQEHYDDQAKMVRQEMRAHGNS